MAKFEIGYAITMKSEGGYANDPADTGGETFGGLSRVANPNWAGWRIVDAIKKTTTRANYDKVMFASSELMALVRSAYKIRYWDVNRLDAVNDQAIANELFDTGVNMGIGISSRFLQRTLNVTNQNQALYPDLLVDGVVGPKTIQVLNLHPYPTLVLKVLNVMQGNRYIEIAEKAPVQEKFMRSWFSRVTL